MGFAALMSVLVVPYLMTLFIRGHIAPEEKNPVNRLLIRAYHPFVRFVLRHRALTILTALLLMASTVPVVMRLGSEFMPPLYEGSLLYMPIALPGASVQTTQSTGIRTPVGVKVFGPNLDGITDVAGEVESTIRMVRATRATCSPSP